MYKLKPYYDSSRPVELPDCMYKMKTTSGHEGQVTKTSENTVDVAYLAQLESRQEDVLKRLESLKAEVLGLAKSTGVSAATQNTAPTDLVVSADPSAPPLSLLVLTRLLSSQYKVLTVCHCHSSVRDVPLHLKTLFSNNHTLNRHNCNMIITLVWKNVGHGPTLMINPKSQVVLEGEGTIARHLARLLRPSYEDGDVVMATEIDQWVDTASQYKKGNNKEKNSVLKNMNSKLGKSDWLVGEGLSLADVVMWGVLVGSNGVPGNVKSWLDRCSDRPEFAAVLKQLNTDV